MISAFILFGSFFFGLLGLLFYIPIVGLFIPGASINTIDMTPMFVFPVLIVIFAFSVHFITDEAMDRIGRGGEKLIKVVPYLVLASLVVYVAYIIRGNDFMLFTPYYWFHNYLDTFDLIFIIIQFLVAFLIGLSIFGATGFSYDRYVDVTYESTAYSGDFEVKRSDSYVSRSQFYLTAFIGVLIGVLMSFTAFAIVASIFYFSFVIIGRFKVKALKDKPHNFRARDRFVGKQIVTSVSLALVAAAAVTLGVLVNDYRLEKPTDMMNIVLNDENDDDFLSASLHSNTTYIHEEVRYNLNLGVRLFSKKSAYDIDGLQIRIDLTYQKIEVETGEVQATLTTNETLDFDHVYSDYIFREIAPYTNVSPHHLAYVVLTQEINLVKGTAACRYDISKGFPYRKIGARDLNGYFLLGVGYPEEDGYHYFVQILTNLYIKELFVELNVGNNQIIELNFTDTFLLKNQRVEVHISEDYQDIDSFSYDYAKGYIAFFYVN